MLAFDNESIYNSGVKKSASSRKRPAVLTCIPPTRCVTTLGVFFLQFKNESPIVASTQRDDLPTILGTSTDCVNVADVCIKANRVCRLGKINGYGSKDSTPSCRSVTTDRGL